MIGERTDGPGRPRDVMRLVLVDAGTDVAGARGYVRMDTGKLGEWREFGPASTHPEIEEMIAAMLPVYAAGRTAREQARARIAKAAGQDEG